MAYHCVKSVSSDQSNGIRKDRGRNCVARAETRARDFNTLGFFSHQPGI
jgi:hypothetical protein